MDMNWKAFFNSLEVVDLSVMVGNDWPCNWPTIMGYHTSNWNMHDSWRGDFFTRYMIMEEHTGTHMDAPCHFIPLPESGLPHAGPAGEITVEKVPIGQTMGPALVIDCRSLRGHAANGESPLITIDFVHDWERENGKIEPGDVVLFYTAWTDDTYDRMPAGKAFGVDVILDKKAPGWPAPDVSVMEYLASVGVLTIGVDTGSMGSLQDDAAAHHAGLKHGMVFIERLTNLGKLPTRGAAFVFLGIKIEGGSGSAGRAIAMISRQ
jgi:kynurenine formamidase